MGELPLLVQQQDSLMLLAALPVCDFPWAAFSSSFLAASISRDTVRCIGACCSALCASLLDGPLAWPIMAVLLSTASAAFLSLWPAEEKKALQVNGSPGPLHLSILPPGAAIFPLLLFAWPNFLVRLVWSVSTDCEWPLSTQQPQIYGITKTCDQGWLHPL